MYWLRVLVIISLNLFFLLSSKAQSIDVLFIGNSYTYYNDLPLLVSNIALSFGDTVNFESSTPGGASLFGHTNNTSTLAKINQQPWDYVVLQEQSQKPSLSPSFVSSNVFPYATQLVDAIYLNNSCTEPLFYMTWGRKNGDASNCVAYPSVCTYSGMQQRLRESYLEMGITNSASVSPVGVAWKNFMEIDSITNLYTADESHPSIYGSYLAACTFYATLFKKSPIGSTSIPNQIDAATANLIQNVASNTVLDSLSTWNVFNADFTIDTSSSPVFFTNLSSNYDSLVWFFGDGNSSFDTNPNHYYSSAGNFEIELVAYTNDGCLTDTASYNYNIPPLNKVEEQQCNGIYIYPNPASNFIKINIPDSYKSFKIEFYDFSGQLIKTSHDKSIDISNFKSGFFYLKTYFGKDIFTTKVLKI